MIKPSISLQDLRRKIYLKAKADKTWRLNAVASAGTDGVGPESAAGSIGPINF